MTQHVKIVSNDGETARLESVPCTCGRRGCEGVIEPTITRNPLMSSRAQFIERFPVGKLMEIDQDHTDDVNADQLADAEAIRRYEEHIAAQAKATK